MSKTQDRNRRESNAEIAKSLEELSSVTGLEVSGIRKLLNSYTMSEIRNGKTVRWRWIPKESVTARPVSIP